jgi:hypothetical protein
MRFRTFLLILLALFFALIVLGLSLSPLPLD